MSWSDVQVVMVVPVKGDPLKLLADGDWGAKPPKAVRLARGLWVPDHPHHHVHRPKQPRALVLWSRGRALPEGGIRLGHYWDDLITLDQVVLAVRSEPEYGELLCLDRAGAEVTLG